MLEPVELDRIAHDDELRRRALEPLPQRADGMDRQVLEVRVCAGLLRHLRHVELVADVAVEVEALGDDCIDRLERRIESDRLEQELADRGSATTAPW